MIQNPKIIKKYFINEDKELNEAIKKINTLKLKFLIVVDNKLNIAGILTDGDIRRSLIKYKFNSKVKIKICSNKRYSFFDKIKNKQVNKGNNKIVKDLNFLPVVKNGQCIKIVLKPKLILRKKLFNDVLIFAGGLGKRLRPITNKIPKPLVKVKNKPLIEHVIGSFRKQNLNNFIISIKYKKNLIKKYFSKKNYKIKYIEEKKYLGTAGCLSLLDNNVQFPIIAINTDVLIKLNYQKILKYHKLNKADFTICGIQKTFGLPFGEITTNKNIITKIIEKPQKPYIINAGIYIFEKQIVNLIKKNEPLQMNELIMRAIKRKYKVVNYPIYENWIDAGTIKDIKKIEKK